MNAIAIARPCTSCNGTGSSGTRRVGSFFDLVTCFACNGTGTVVELRPDVSTPDHAGALDRVAALAEDAADAAEYFDLGGRS